MTTSTISRQTAHQFKKGELIRSTAEHFPAAARDACAFLLYVLLALFLGGCPQDEPPPCQTSCFSCGVSDGCGGICPCSGNQECVGGSCMPRCPHGRCGGVCTPCSDGQCPSATDRQHCGAISGASITINGTTVVEPQGSCTACSEGEICKDAQCSTCAVGTNACDNACVTSSNAQCGKICRRCPAQSNCTDDVCKCDDPRAIDCGKCVVPDTVQHCGGCQPCRLQGEECVMGTCKCPSGMIACGNECVVPNTNQHCGSCEETCPANSTCKQLSASGSKVRCVCNDKNSEFCSGTCIDVQSSNLNCGLCGHRCRFGQSCEEGKCIATNTGCGPCTPTKPCCWKTGRCERPGVCDSAPEPQ